MLREELAKDKRRVCGDGVGSAWMPPEGEGTEVGRLGVSSGQEALGFGHREAEGLPGAMLWPHWVGRTWDRRPGEVLGQGHDQMQGRRAH